MTREADEYVTIDGERYTVEEALAWLLSHAVTYTEPDPADCVSPHTNRAVGGDA